jgi:hypothetical protein
MMCDLIMDKALLSLFPSSQDRLVEKLIDDELELAQKGTLSSNNKSLAAQEQR